MNNKEQISIITDSNITEELERIKKDRIKLVSIRDHYTGKNINFLYKVRDIIEDVIADADSIKDYSVLNDLKNLKGFSIGEVKEGDNIKLDNFANLKSVGIASLNKIENIDELKKIEVLYISSGSISIKDLKRLPVLQNLQKLVIQYMKFDFNNIFEVLNAPRLDEIKLIKLNSISLSGIENYKYISSLTLNSIKNVIGINNLSSLKNLELIDITSCREIEDLISINKIQKLKTLKLDKISPLNNLDFLTSLKNLTFLSIIDTLILPGDVKMLMQLPTLKYLGIYPIKKIYNITENELNEFNKNEVK